MAAITNNWRATLFAIFLAALLVRTVFVLTLQEGYYFPDSEIYSKAALNLLSHSELGSEYNRPPAYPVFLAAVYLFSGESIFAARMAEAVLGALLALVIALIGRRIGGAPVGALAGILWSIYPLGIFISGLIYPTGILTALLALGLLCFLPYAQGESTVSRVFVTGALWGLAALAKPIVIATVGAVSMWILIWGKGMRLAAVTLLLLGAAVILVPWGIRDYFVYGHLVVVEPRAVQHLPHMHSAEGELRKDKIQAIVRHPEEYLSRVGREFTYFWRLYPNRITMDKPGFREKWHEAHPKVVRETVFATGNLITAVSLLSTGPVFLFAIVGVLAMLFDRERRRDLALLSTIILSFAVTYSFFFVQTRFRIPVEPYLIIISACGMVRTFEFLAARLGRRQQVRIEAEVGQRVES